MPSIDRWLLRDVTVSGTRVDCRIRDGRIAELAPQLIEAGGETVIEGNGGELLPGLADHHIHLRALAAARRSLDLHGADLTEVPRDAGSGWLRVIGAGVELTRADIDAVWPERPVRVQHRSGALWTLNSMALERLGPGASADEVATGQFWRSGERLRAMLDLGEEADLAAVSADLAGYGITHVTDASPKGDPSTLTIDQHVLSLAATGTGPRKLVIADHDLPDLDVLIQAISRTHADGRGVALHVVSAVAIALALAAIDAAGSDEADRIEHAAVCDDDSARRIAELGITVVTQPSILERHGHTYLRDSEQRERALLWRYGGLLRAGVRAAVSSDAPYGEPDPWATIRAAATRVSDGVPVGPDDERVAPTIALASMLAEPHDPAGAQRVVRVGAAADLCLLDSDLPTALDHAIRSGPSPVRATFIAGTLRYPPASPGGATAAVGYGP
jgi:predicted amidohydrolase YtcJ